MTDRSMPRQRLLVLCWLLAILLGLLTTWRAFYDPIDPDSIAYLDSIGIPILRLPSRPHDTKARWGEEGTCCGPMMGWM
jgi:hypothetical protein